MRDAPQAAAPPVSTRRRMSGAYQPLFAYLEKRYADTAVLTLEQIESLLGFALPERAKRDIEWWTARETGTAALEHRDAWLLAGRTAQPNLAAGVVAFERASP
jgi:hypothetical protein